MANKRTGSKPTRRTTTSPRPTSRADAAPSRSLRSGPALQGHGIRGDDWTNVLLGYGTARDARQSTEFVPTIVRRQQAEDLWRGDDMAARIVETPPDEMLREGFEITITAIDSNAVEEPIEPDAILSGEGVDPNDPNAAPVAPGAKPQGKPGDEPPSGDEPPPDDDEQRPQGKPGDEPPPDDNPADPNAPAREPGAKSAPGAEPDPKSTDPKSTAPAREPAPAGESDPAEPDPRKRKRGDRRDFGGDFGGGFGPPPPKEPKPIQIDDAPARMAADVKAALDELGVIEAFREALYYERAFGGGGILVGANDGQTDLTQPLKLDQIRSVDWLTVLTPRELTAVRWYADPRAPKYGQPEVYQINPDLTPTGERASSAGAGKARKASEQVAGGLIRVHESRLILFPGIKISRSQVRNNSGWGDSVFNRVVGVLRDFNLGWHSAAVLLKDFAQGVFKLKGLAELFESDRDDVVIKRIQAIDQSRSTLRAAVLDAEGEDFTRQQTPMSGLPETLDRFCNRLSAAARMPVTMIMGQSPAGLNATGASDVRFFYDGIKSEQSRKLRPRLETITRMVMLSTDGPTGGVEPDEWTITFPELWQPTPKETAEIRKLYAEIDTANIASGVYSPEEAAASRYGSGKFSTEIVLDLKGREAMAAEPAPFGDEPPPVDENGNPIEPDPNAPPPKGAPPKPGIPFKGASPNGDPGPVPKEGESGDEPAPDDEQPPAREPGAKGPTTPQRKPPARVPPRPPKR